jgi:DNA-directed RNA polymerase specialized sigma24 family protein
VGSAGASVGGKRGSQKGFPGLKVLYLYQQTRHAGLHARSADPAALVFEKMTTEHVTAAIAALPEEFRTVCTLYFMQEFAYQEIAEIVDCPPPPDSSP